MSTTTTPLAGTYVADPVHSSFGFAVRYQGVSIFRGTLDEVDAKLVDGRLEQRPEERDQPPQEIGADAGDQA